MLMLLLRKLKFLRSVAGHITAHCAFCTSVSDIEMIDCYCQLNLDESCVSLSTVLL